MRWTSPKCTTWMFFAIFVLIVNHHHWLSGVHEVDFSGVRDDKCNTVVGSSRVKPIKLTTCSAGWWSRLWIFKCQTYRNDHHDLRWWVRQTPYSSLQRWCLFKSGQFTCNDGQCIDIEQRWAFNSKTKQILPEIIIWIENDPTFHCIALSTIEKPINLSDTIYQMWAFNSKTKQS